MRKGDTPSRQGQILALSIKGHTDAEIGRLLSLDSATVDAYWRRIRKRFGASSRTRCASTALACAYAKTGIHSLADLQLLLAAADELVAEASARQALETAQV